MVYKRYIHQRIHDITLFKQIAIPQPTYFSLGLSHCDAFIVFYV